MIDELYKIRKEFGEDFDRTKNFQIYSYLSQMLSWTLLIELHPDRNSQAKEYLLQGHADLEENVDMFGTLSEEIGGDEGYMNILIEKVFIDHYRVFEEFILKIFTLLGRNFPLLLFKDKESLSIKFKDVFSMADLESLKDQLVYDTVNSIINSENLCNAIDILGKKFALPGLIGEDYRRQIHIASALRNVVIHNGAKFNKIADDKLKKANIQISLKNGDIIFEYLKSNNENLRSDLGNCAIQIFETIKSELPRIQSYHNGKGSD